MGPVVEAMGAGEAPDGCRVIWLTPLRALAQDTARSLTEPLAALGSGLEVAVRTGDTSSHRKAKLRERLPFALVTTPESLSLMDCLNTHELSRTRFREVARVAGLIQQMQPGDRKGMRQIQTSAGLLFEVFGRYDPD